MHHVAIRAIRHLFHQDLAQTHVDAALDLAHHQHRVDRLANVMSDPDSFHDDNAGRGIDIDFSHGRGITVSRRRTDARAFVLAGRARRRIRSNGADRAEL